MLPPDPGPILSTPHLAQLADHRLARRFGLWDLASVSGVHLSECAYSDRDRET
jgi:hypothetical protein